jgi:hypothetical protein
MTLKWILKNLGAKTWDSSGWGPKADSCEHGNKLLGSIMGRGRGDLLNNQTTTDFSRRTLLLEIN